VCVPYHAQAGSNAAVIIGTDGTNKVLLSNTFISVFPLTSNATPFLSYNYYDSVGTYMIQKAELKIGGQSIQTLSGEYIELWNDLNIPYENQPGLKLLTGKYDTATQVYPPGRTYFANLPFYFFGNPGLALPLTALGRQDVEVHVTFRNLQELTPVATSTITTPLTATIITEYVYLSDPEIQWFQKSQLDYVIQQCQYQTISLLPNFSSAIFQLNFLHPIRELFFVVQFTGALPYVYSDLQSLALSFNGAEAFTDDVTDALYLNSIEPFNHYINYPTRQYYMYSFTSRAESPVPAGQVNFSRIRQVLLRLTTLPYASPKEFRIIGVNYNILRVQDGLAGIMFN
jgi:hypothetical protein